MKRIIYSVGILIGLLLSVPIAEAQQRRGGGGGGGFGGFPGFGGFGGGFGGLGGGGQTSARQYPQNGTVGDAVISIDPETKNIVVIADEETAKYISEVIASLDKPMPQVLIKVIFVEVTYNNSLDIGLKGAYLKNLGGSTTGSVANVFGLSGLNSTNSPVNGFGVPVQSVQGAGAGVYSILSADYQVTLRAIAQAGKTEVLSRPSILTRNSQPATIKVGQSVPLITDVRYDNFGNAINSIDYRDVGIILNVTPYINAEGLVEMILAPEISALTDQSIPIGNGVNLPVISERSADTVVVTPDGQTVIIGGLMQKAKIENDSKIPWLGDIPVLGNLFKRKSKNGSRTELLIFLTPHIVENPSHLSGVTQVERGNAELAPKAFTEAELNKYLDPAKKYDPENPPLPAIEEDKKKRKKRK